MAPPSRLVVATAIAGATAYVAYEAYADSNYRRKAKEEVAKRDEGVKKAMEEHRRRMPWCSLPYCCGMTGAYTRRRFEAPIQRYLANQGPSSMAVFDLSVCASFGFILSTLSHESARVLHGWLKGLARMTTPGADVGDLELCGDTLANLLMGGLQAEKQVQNKKEADCRLFVRRYTTVKIDSAEQMRALKRTLEACGLSVCYADRLARWALWPTTMEESIITVRALPLNVCRNDVRYGPWSRLQDAEQREVLLANFDMSEGYDCVCVCNPETGIVTSVEDVVTPLAAPDLSSLNTRKGRKNKPSRPQSYEPSRPQSCIPALESALGCIMVSRWAGELLKSTSVERLLGCSLEHCQVMSGEHMMVAELRKHRGSTDAIDILQVMRGMDLKLLLDSRDRVVDGLTDRLMEKLPGPPEAVDPSKAVMKEVDAFVSDLLRVLEMKLLSTPVSASKEVPADVVRDTGVRANAVRSILKNDGSLTTNLLMVVRDTQRVRDQQLESVTAVPPTACVAIALLLSFTVLSVLLADKQFCLLLAALIQRCLPYSTHTIVPYLRSPVLHFTIQLLTLAHISHVTYHTYGCRDLRTYRSNIERPVFLLVCRMLNSCGLRGWKLPALSAAECREYETRCAAQMRVWGVRIAVRNMQDTCARPRIGASEVLQVMDDMARVATDVHVVSKRIEKARVGSGRGAERHDVRVRVELGTMPVEVTEALMQTFMNMDVEEEEDFKPSAAGGHGDARSGRGGGNAESVYGAVMDLSSDITGAFESAMKETLMLPHPHGCPVVCTICMAAPHHCLNVNDTLSDLTRAIEQIQGDRDGDVWQEEDESKGVAADDAEEATHTKSRGSWFEGGKGAASGANIYRGNRTGHMSSASTINAGSNGTMESATSASASNAASTKGSSFTSRRLRAGKNRSVDSVLKEHGWTLVRRKTHYVYKRVIRDNGSVEGADVHSCVHAVGEGQRAAAAQDTAQATGRGGDDHLMSLKYHGVMVVAARLSWCYRLAWKPVWPRYDAGVRRDDSQNHQERSYMILGFDSGRAFGYQAQTFYVVVLKLYACIAEIQAS